MIYLSITNYYYIESADQKGSYSKQMNITNNKNYLYNQVCAGIWNFIFTFPDFIYPQNCLTPNVIYFIFIKKMPLHAVICIKKGLKIIHFRIFNNKNWISRLLPLMLAKEKQGLYFTFLKGGLHHIFIVNTTYQPCKNTFST